MRVIRGHFKCCIKGSDQSALMPARVSLFDADNNYYAPVDTFFYGHGFAVGWPADWGIKGRQKYFYTQGEFELTIPCKKIKIIISRGFEYEIYEEEITIQPDRNLLNVELKRIIDMPELGWYCGDNHSHFDHAPLDYKLTKQDGLSCASAEGLDFIFFLHKNTDPPVSIEAEDITGHFAYEYGHHPVLNTGVCPPQNLTSSLKDHGDWFSLNDWVHGNTDGTIIMGHPLFANHLYSGLLANDYQTAFMTHYEIPVNTILEKVDTFELQNNRQSILATWLRIWYRLLNCGINLPASAGTDACISVKTTLPLGIYRSYVKSDENKLDSYLAGLKAGHSFITDGPLLFFKVNGVEPGERIDVIGKSEPVKIKLQVKSVFPLPAVELIRDGNVIKQWELNGEKEFSASFECWIEKSCFLALRVLRLRKKTDQSEITELFAHTNPVYVYYNAEPRTSSEDAMFFLQWIEVIKKYRLAAPDTDAAIAAITPATQKYLAQLNEVDLQQWPILQQNIKALDIHTLDDSEELTIDEKVILKKTGDEDFDTVFKVFTIDLQADNFYKVCAESRKKTNPDEQDTGGYVYCRLVIFDQTGNYLGTAEDKSSGEDWQGISTLIYLPAECRQIQLACCLGAPGEIEFKDIKINRLKGGLFKIS